MIVASYRNTDKGIKAAARKPVAVPPPVARISDAKVKASVDAKRKQFVAALVPALGARFFTQAPKPAPVRQPYKPRFDQIAKRMCRVFGVTMVDLRSPRRDRDTVCARQAIYYWARRQTPLSLPQIARLIGGRDHTTVMYGIAKYQKRRLEMGRYLRAVKTSRGPSIQSGEAQ